MLPHLFSSKIPNVGDFSNWGYLLVCKVYKRTTRSYKIHNPFSFLPDFHYLSKSQTSGQQCHINKCTITPTLGSALSFPPSLRHPVSLQQRQHRLALKLYGKPMSQSDKKCCLRWLSHQHSRKQIGYEVSRSPFPKSHHHPPAKSSDNEVSAQDTPVIPLMKAELLQPKVLDFCSIISTVLLTTDNLPPILERYNNTTEWLCETGNYTLNYSNRYYLKMKVFALQMPIKCCNYLSVKTHT